MCDIENLIAMRGVIVRGETGHTDVLTDDTDEDFVLSAWVVWDSLPLYSQPD